MELYWLWSTEGENIGKNPRIRMDGTAIGGGEYQTLPGAPRTQAPGRAEDVHGRTGPESLTRAGCCRDPTLLSWTKIQALAWSCWGRFRGGSQGHKYEVKHLDLWDKVLGVRFDTRKRVWGFVTCTRNGLLIRPPKARSMGKTPRTSG